MLRRLLAMVAVLGLAVLLGGCVVISGVSTSQPSSMGSVRLTVFACADGSPGCSETPNSGSVYGLLLGASNHDPHPAQLLFAVRLPEGAVPPDALTGSGAAPAPITFARSLTYEAELQAFEPAPTGERWWGWLSTEFPYDIDTAQSLSVAFDVALPRPADGGPYPSPMRWRPVVGTRWVDVGSGRLATRPVDCGTLPANLYQKVDSDANICIDFPDQTGTRGYLDAPLIDFGVLGTTVQASAGSTTTAIFLAKRSGNVDPTTTFSLAVSGGPPGGTVTIDRSTVSLGGESTTPVLATVVVPAGTPASSYPLTLTATAPGKPTRTGTATVVVPPPPASPAPPADTSSPVIRSSSLTPARVTLRRSVAAPRSALGVNLSEAASLAVQVDRLAPGRRAGRACSLTSKTGARCTRTTPLGTLRRAAPAGASRGTVGPRVGGKPLGPGRYRLILRATDAAGNRSAARTLFLTVVRR